MSSYSACCLRCIQSCCRQSLLLWFASSRAIASCCRVANVVCVTSCDSHPVVLLPISAGDMGTGRTTLVLRFIREPTIGAAFFTQILSSAEATVKFDIWDTSEQERYHNLAPMYYSGSVAAIVMYDVSSMDTFIRVKNGFKNCKDKHLDDDPSI
ncbi:ras-related protein RHN1 [Manihot esculenta]|uniref:ras-related protein RHN1 n=1 Tax=Manihot esculenta TaxID=3983 RepID=UPI000B5D29A6|nr:ras-related protein RHN1 [Manihot esculenta]